MKKKQILFIHSAGPQGIREGSDELLRYLRKRLEQDFEIVSPLMPEPEHPDYDRWIAILDEEIHTMNDNVLAIGHSLGGSVLLKYLSEESYDKHIKGLFLIAAPFWGEPDWEVKEYILKEDFKTRLPVIPGIFIYHSEDDDVVPINHAKRYAASLPVTLYHRLHDRGHLFSKGLPELVDDIKRFKP